MGEVVLLACCLAWSQTVNACLHQRFLDTHRQVWLSLLWGHCSFFPGSWCTQVLFVPSKSLFPRYYGNSVIKFHWPPMSNSLGDPQVEKSVVGPRTFLTVNNFFGVIVLELVGHLLSDCMLDNTAWPRSAAARAPVHMAGHCWPVPLQETLKHSNVGLAQSLLGLWCAQGFIWALWTSLVDMGFDSKCDFAPLPSCWGFSFALEHGVSFFGGIQHSPVDGCSAESCNFGVLPGEDEHTSFHSSILKKLFFNNGFQVHSEATWLWRLRKSHEL